MTIRDPFYQMPVVFDWEAAARVFAKLGGDKYVRTVSLHRKGNKEYQLRWYPNSDSYALMRSGNVTIMYEKPDANGKRVVRVMNHDYKNMNGFFHHHGWGSWVPKLTTTEGKRVIAPFVPHKETVLALDADSKLIVAESKHGTLYSMYTDDDRKAEVAALHQLIEPLVNLCLMRVDDSLQQADVVHRYANRTFAGIDTNQRVPGHGYASDIIRNFLSHADAEISEPLIQAFFLVTDEVVKYKLSKAWAKTESHLFDHRLDRARAGVDHESVRTSLQYVCTKLVRLDKANSKRELGQFPAKMPHRVFL